MVRTIINVLATTLALVGLGLLIALFTTDLAYAIVGGF